MSDLHIQLATGKKAQTYGQMGNDRSISLRMRGDIQEYEGYNDAIKRANIHLGTVQTVIKNISAINENARSDFNGTATALHDGSYKQVKVGAEQRLNDGIALINEKIAGKYLFSGTKVDTAPVETMSNIMNGVGNKAGLKQVIAERKLADLGPLNNGRLTTDLTTDVISIAEDGDHPFGMKISSISQNFTGVTNTETVGPPKSTAIDFSAAAPIEDQQITVKFTMPDGKDFDVVIKAKTQAPTDKDGFVIGANPAQNAANFKASIDAAVEFAAKGEMAAGSTVVASDGFFGEPPKRVDGPPFETATAIVDGTDANTLSWYKGDKTPDGARDSYKIYGSKNSVLSAGARADEAPIKNFVKNLSMMVAESFDPTSAESNAHYGALKSRVTVAMLDTNDSTSLLELSTELGYKEKHLENLTTRNTSRVNLSKNILSDVESSDTYEVSAKILTLKTQLEMAYKTTSLLSQTHLINFL